MEKERKQESLVKCKDINKNLRRGKVYLDDDNADDKKKKKRTLRL